MLITRMTRNTVGSALSKWLSIELRLRIEENVCRGPCIIVPERRQTTRPALVFSTQAAGSSHPELFTPLMVSAALKGGLMEHTLK